MFSGGLERDIKNLKTFGMEWTPKIGQNVYQEFDSSKEIYNEKTTQFN